MPDRKGLREADRRPGRGAGRVEGPIYNRNPRRRGRRRSLRGRRGRCQDPDEAVREAAYRALGEWMSANTAPVLFALAGSPGNDHLQIRALRGYLRIARPLAAWNAERLAMSARPLRRPVTTTNAGWPSRSCCGSARPKSLALAVGHLRDPALAETAGKVAVGIADKIVARHPAAVAQALPQVIAATKATWLPRPRRSWIAP